MFCVKNIPCLVLHWNYESNKDNKSQKCMGSRLERYTEVWSNCWHLSQMLRYCFLVFYKRRAVVGTHVWKVLNVSYGVLGHVLSETKSSVEQTWKHENSLISPRGLVHIQPERKKEAIRFSSAHFLFIWDLAIASFSFSLSRCLSLYWPDTQKYTYIAQAYKIIA